MYILRGDEGRLDKCWEKYFCHYLEGKLIVLNQGQTVQDYWEEYIKDLITFHGNILSNMLDICYIYIVKVDLLL